VVKIPPSLTIRCDGMTDAETLNFLDHWLTDVGQTMRELSAAIERLYDRVNRERGACHSAEDTLVTIISNSASSISTISAHP
jgi:uncharacterized protein YoxC